MCNKLDQKALDTGMTTLIGNITESKLDDMSSGIRSNQKHASPPTKIQSYQVLEMPSPQLLIDCETLPQTVEGPSTQMFSGSLSTKSVSSSIHKLEKE